MATKVYDSKTIKFINNKTIYLTPLKIKYLREFMVVFDMLRDAKNDEDSIIFLSECVRIAMQQYDPSITTTEQVEDLLDLPTMYEILEIGAGIKLNKKSEKEIEIEKEEEGNSWKDLDLAKLEAEVFLLGMYKDYEDLESSLSMPELMLTLSQKRELDYQEKRFLAGMQGVDLDEQSGNSQNKWEEMKARVFSKGKATDSNDVLALQGVNAQKAGFGIGMGLGYEDLTKK
jgi:hypothetical protein